MNLLLKYPFDEVLAQLTLDGVPSSPKKILFRGEGTGGIASYAAGWMAGKGMDVIVLDGANRFNPYIASPFARKALISPEEILKRIRIARAFTCYQMATLMGEHLPALLKEERATVPTKNPWVVLLGPITTFLDEDVPEREIRPLFERALQKMEEMALRGIPFFLFQPSVPSDSRRAYLTKRLSQFSDLAWKIDLDEQGTKMVLEKGLIKHSGIRDLDLQIVNPKFQITNPK
ncbi:MAG: hypothetical protein KGZ49_02680 [Syntrophaceae bacterium]|nr:hypothetical protein [Syntrophaceae bacterium]